MKVRRFFPFAAILAGLASREGDADAQLGQLAQLAAEPDAGSGGACPGPWIERSSPPPAAAGGARACSPRRRVCVQAAPATPPAFTLAALASAERAWRVLTGPLGLPPPDGDGGEPWTAYLVDGVEGAGTALATGRDPVARLDRAESFALVDRATPPGCALDLALARAVARGALWRAAPATDAGDARAQAESLARLAVACSSGDDDVRIFQSEPERTVVDPTAPAFDRGASLFFDWLDATFATQPGALVSSLWALAATRTAPGEARWSGRPTTFDVLQVSFKNALWEGSTLDDVLAEASAARALADPPARAAWHIPWPERPRRLAAPVPTSPTGASYVVIDRAGAPAGAKLRVEAEWEDYARMRWTVVKVDAQGRAIAELPVTSLDRGTRAAMTIEPLDGVDRVVVVGTNVGSTEQPFDPDDGVWEPHGWLLTVQAE